VSIGDSMRGDSGTAAYVARRPQPHERAGTGPFCAGLSTTAAARVVGP
jgi:hypothetical protein